MADMPSLLAVGNAAELRVHLHREAVALRRKGRGFPFATEQPFHEAFNLSITAAGGSPLLSPQHGVCEGQVAQQQGQFWICYT